MTKIVFSFDDKSAKKLKNIKNIFTRVLKGHIGVVLSNINKLKTGNKIDFIARKWLKKNYLLYQLQGLKWYELLQVQSKISRPTHLKLHDYSILQFLDLFLILLPLQWLPCGLLIRPNQKYINHNCKSNIKHPDWIVKGYLNLIYLL